MHAVTQPSRLPGHPRNSLAGGSRLIPPLNSGSTKFSTELCSSWIVVVGLFLLSEFPLCRARVLPRPLFPPLTVVLLELELELTSVALALVELTSAAGGFVTTLLLTNPRANPLPPPPPRVFEKSSTVDDNSSKLDRVEVKVEGVVVL